MTYRVICTYHPEIGTFRGKRGAWRVFDCYSADSGLRFEPVKVITLTEAHGPQHLLCIYSTKPRQRNSWCNPRFMLAEWQKAMRG